MSPRSGISLLQKTNKQTRPEAKTELGPNELADNNKEHWQEILTVFKKKYKNINLFKYPKASRLGPDPTEWLSTAHWMNIGDSFSTDHVAEAWGWAFTSV